LYLFVFPVSEPQLLPAGVGLFGIEHVIIRDV